MKLLVHTPSLGAICLAGSEGIQYIPACQLGYCLWAFIQTFKEKNQEITQGTFQALFLGYQQERKRKNRFR